eukprot:2830292-Amphidinium_carterae.2
MFNDLCANGNTLVTRDELQLRLIVESGVNKIRDAIRQTQFTRVFIVCGGDANAWGMPPVRNKMASLASRRFRQMGIPAITGAGFFRKINNMNAISSNGTCREMTTSSLL